MTQVRYQVSVHAADDQVATRFVNWMLSTHADEVLAVPGCEECRVFQSQDTLHIHCEYIFASQSDLDVYIADYAPRLRRSYLHKFDAADLSFERQQLCLIFEKKK